jgi:hypothetical protein
MKKIMLIFLALTTVTLTQTVTGRSNKGSIKPKKLITEQKYYAPFLVAEVDFWEPSGNNVLDAKEDSFIKLTIKNIGSMPAQECDIEIIPSTFYPSIEIQKADAIKKLESGEEIKVNLSVKAGSMISTGNAMLTLKILEKDGFDLEPEKVIIIPTRVFQPPKPEVADYGIEDEDGNNKIKQGEKVTLTFRIQNNGETPSYNTRVRIFPGENVIPVDINREYILGDLNPGEYKDISAIINTYARATEVKVTTVIKEYTNKYGSNKTYNLPFNVVQKNSEELIIKKKVFIPNDENPQLDVSSNIPRSSVNKENAVAVIIGNKDYMGNVPSVDFTLNDAALMKNYVEQALGYSSENIIYIENAYQSDLTKVFGTENNYKGQLYDRVKPNLSDVFIYYSGHGAPDPETKKGYLVPVDCDPNKVAINGYSLQNLFLNLDKIAAEKKLQNVTVVLDACFSGNSMQGNLLENISPIYLTFKNQSMTYENSAVFTSAAGDQVSNWYPDKKQSLFTYFFLNGLKGEADLNKDNSISTQELYNYTADEINGVPYVSRRLFGRTQNPTFSGKDYNLFH